MGQGCLLQSWFETSQALTARSPLPWQCRLCNAIWEQNCWKCTKFVTKTFKSSKTIFRPSDSDSSHKSLSTGDIYKLQSTCDTAGAGTSPASQIRRWATDVTIDGLKFNSSAQSSASFASILSTCASRPLPSVPPPITTAAEAAKPAGRRRKPSCTPPAPARRGL